MHQHDPRRGLAQPALPAASARKPAWPTTSTRFQTDYAECGTLQVYAGVDPDRPDADGRGDPRRAAPAARRAGRRWTSSIAPAPTPSGRLELRLEESRHVSAWLGVQEALHDRVLTLDEALAELDEVTPEAIQALAQQLFPTTAVHGGHRAAATPRQGLEKALTSSTSTERGTMNERTLILIKPDGVQRALIGKIVERYEARGLRIVGMKMVHADRALAEQHYAVHREKPFFAGLVEFITSAPLVAMAVEGLNAIAVCREINGATRPHEAAPGSHPRRPGTRTGHNLVHGSDSAENAADRAGAVVQARRAVRLHARHRPLGDRPRRLMALVE